MKRFIGFALVAALAVSSLSAQAWNRGPEAAGQSRIENAESVTIEGRLSLVNGMIAVQSQGKTYYTSGLNRLFGFVDGLKEGASVRIEGYASPLPVAPEYVQLRAVSLVFNGKSYDLSSGPGQSMGGRSAVQNGKTGRSNRGSGR